jgi:hypothetical protein
MYNNTIGDWRDKIIALKPGYDLNIEYYNTNITSYSDFNMLLSVEFIMNLSDSLNIAEINKHREKDVLISVEGTEDPIFPVNTVGYVGRKIVIFPYPYHAVKIGTGTIVSDSCSGNVTFNPSDPDAAQKILVTQDSAGISGFLGVVSENAAVQGTSCYLLNVPDAIEKSNQTVNISGYRELYIDQQTQGVWSLPVKEAIEEGYYSAFSVSGPDIMMRLEGDMSSKENGYETFVNLPELQSAGLPVDPNKVSIAYIYFSSEPLIGNQVRGLQDWFRIDIGNAAKYNITELIV